MNIRNLYEEKRIKKTERLSFRLNPNTFTKIVAFSNTREDNVSNSLNVLINYGFKYIEEKFTENKNNSSPENNKQNI